LYLPDLFWKYRRPIALIALLGILCLFMIDSLQQKWIERAGRQLMQSATYPIQKTSEQTHDGARNVLSLLPDFFRTRAQNVALKRRVSELEQELVTLREEMLRAGRIRELEESNNSIEGKELIARVIGVNPTIWFSAVIIDKGSSDGIEKFMPAVSASGLAGYVVEVYLYSSKVLLLTDPNSKVSVMTQRSRARGVVQGDESAGCLLKYVESTADVKEGDVLVTSGNSKIYPEGLLVGRIETLTREAGTLFQQARVAPATDFEKLEEVAIILESQTPMPEVSVEE